MTDKVEDELIALMSREQRGFRTILYVGVVILALLLVMSAALGFYYFQVSQALGTTSTELQHEAFDTRIRMDQQNNRVVAQEIRLRRIQDEIRSSLGGGSSADLSQALAATRLYLQRGSHPSANERAIENIARAGAEKSGEPAYALIAGAASLIAWQRSGEQIPADANALPDPLAAASGAFERAKADPALRALANNGLAWVQYLNASSGRSNYAPADCDTVFAAVAASAEGGGIGPQPLYWRAQCERKSGRTRDAFLDYANALDQASGARAPDPAEIELAMNAFHGVGTTMIPDLDAEDDAVRTALELAERTCAPAEGEDGSRRMHLARACLTRAMALRQRLQQTPNQVSGTGENLGFTFLRDENYEGALDHAIAIERTGLFAWNELVRALAASHVRSARASTALAQARRNISFFRVGQFNLCEVRELLSEQHYNEAVRLISNQHPDEDVACAVAAS
jgi:hypothetical protein